jgi:outer membrane protein assembly factor BamB
VLSRRRLLAAGGTAATVLAGGHALANSRSTAPTELDGWPMAQHDPAGRSYAPGADPPTDGVAIRWKRQIEVDVGAAFGVPPVVADGRVYAVGRELLAVDARSGEVRFRAAVDARSAPAVAGARAYRSPTLALNRLEGVAGLGADGGLGVLGRRVGTTRWTAGGSGSDPFGGQPIRTPPVVADGTVLVARNGRLVAVDASDGTVRWRNRGDSPRPAVADGLVYTVDYPNTLRGYDLRSGDLRRTETLPDPALSVTVGPGGPILGVRDGLVALSAEGKRRWRFQPADLSRVRGAVAVDGKRAYAGFDGEDGATLVAVDLADGSERWRSPAAPEREPYFAPPAVADGTVYVPGEDERLAAVDTADGSLRWTFAGDGDAPVPWSPVALAGDTAYAVDGEFLYALEEP